MKFQNALILAACSAFTLAAASPAHAQAAPGTAPAQKPAAQAAAPAEKLDPAKEAAIRHLLDLTEISKMGDNISAGISREVQNAAGRAVAQDQVPKFMQEFSAKFTTAAPVSKVTDAIVPIYAKHFTLEEIQGLTKFYESPLGQKLVKEMPAVVQESQNVGVEMDEAAALVVLRGMQDEYPVLKQMLPPDPNAPAPAAPAATPTPGPGAGSGDSGASSAPPPKNVQPGTPATPKQ
jgi:hypothetical protein